MDLETLKMIVALAEEKSVVRAAERLNVSVKVVEDFCDDFKRETKTNFLDKAFMNRFVSGQGMEVHEKAKKILMDIEHFDKWMNSLRSEPAGDITIVTNPFFGIEWIAPKLKPFLEKYPKVNMKLILKNPPIQAGEGDVVITIPGLIRPKGFTSRELVSVTYSLYASPEYLEKYGVPTAPKDLDNHKFITFGASPATLHGHYNWSLNAGRRENGARKPYFEIDSSLGMFKVAKLGLGIAELPNFDFITRCPDIVNILPSFESPKARFDYICEKDREKTPLIRELYDHLRAYSFDDAPKTLSTNG